MKKAISLLLSSTLALSLLVPCSAHEVNTTNAEVEPKGVVQAVKMDELSGKWYGEAMQKWVDNGVISGYSDGTLRPETNITRGAMAIMIQRIMDYPAASGNAFIDVDVNSNYGPAVYAVSAMNVINGYDNSTFRPNQMITRQQAAVMIERMLYQGNKTAPATNFADQSGIANYAKQAIAVLKDKGFMNGNAQNKFRPNDPITRAEVAVVLSNAIEDIKVTQAAVKGDVIDKAGTYKNNYKGNVHISVSGVSMQDAKVGGDLYIDSTVGDGSAYLKNVSVAGKIYINGGGVNSVHFSGEKYINCDVRIGALRPVRIVCDDGVNSASKIGRVVVAEGSGGVILACPIANLDVQNTAGETTIAGTVDTAVVNTIRPVVVDKAGKVSDMTANHEKAQITVFGKVEKAIVDAVGVTVNGTGTVNAAQVNGNDVSIQTKGTSVTAATGTTGVIAGNVTVPAGGSKTTSGGVIAGGTSGGSTGGSSGGTSGTPVSVTSVTITGVSVENRQLTVDETLQLSATYEPSNATETTKTWTSSNTAVATVSSSGLVTAKSAGTVKITCHVGNHGTSIELTVVSKGVIDNSAITLENLDKEHSGFPYAALNVKCNVNTASGNVCFSVYRKNANNTTTLEWSKTLSVDHIGEYSFKWPYRCIDQISLQAVLESMKDPSIVMDTNTYNVLSGETYTIRAAVTDSTGNGKGYTANKDITITPDIVNDAYFNRSVDQAMLYINNHRQEEGVGLYYWLSLADFKDAGIANLNGDYLEDYKDYVCSHNAVFGSVNELQNLIDDTNWYEVTALPVMQKIKAVTIPRIEYTTSSDSWDDMVVAAIEHALADDSDFNSIKSTLYLVGSLDELEYPKDGTEAIPDGIDGQECFVFNFTAPHGTKCQVAYVSAKLQARPYSVIQDALNHINNLITTGDLSTLQGDDFTAVGVSYDGAYIDGYKSKISAHGLFSSVADLQAFIDECNLNMGTTA